MIVTAFLRCTVLVFLQGTRELLLSRKALFFLAAALIYPFMVGVLFHFLGDQENNNELFAHITSWTMWQVLMPLTAMFFSISAVREEIANRTLVFLQSGPVPRSSVWLGKFLASAFVSTLILAAGSALAVAAAVRTGDDSVQQVTATTLAAPWLPLGVGAPAYCAVGTFLALFFRRPMISGAVYVIGWEQMVGTTPGQAGVRSLTVVDSVRTLFYHRVPDAENFRFVQQEWRGAGEALRMPATGDALDTLLKLGLIALLLGLVIGARKDYDTAPKD